MDGRSTTEDEDCKLPKEDIQEEEEIVVKDASFPEGSDIIPQQQQGRQNDCTPKKLTFLFLGIIAIVVIVATLVTRNKRVTKPTDPIPDTVNYSTGVSLVTYYGIEATIRSRLAQSKVTMVVDNALDCVSIHSISFQLPLGTRVSSLKIISTEDNCITNGNVQELETARENFLQTASKGLPGAYIEQQDSFTYNLQVAMPPLGSTHVEVIVEELLVQRLGQIEFRIPFTPNEQVDQIVFDLTVEDVISNQDDQFYVDIGTNIIPILAEYSNITSTSTRTSTTVVNKNFYINLQDARQYRLPNVLRGWYYPNKIPEHGILYTDGKCFEHFFQPSSLHPMKRNIFFVVDTSWAFDVEKHSIQTALKKFINNTLTPNDTFTIQTFNSRGTDELFGTAPGTESEIMQARDFIDSVPWGTWETNLHEALLEALLRAKADADESSDDTVTILALISNSFASIGEIDPRKIASDVYKLNEEGKVKLFLLGFQGSSHSALLNAIAIMNGGVSKEILKSYDYEAIRRGDIDYSDQIEHFFTSQFGTVLSSDVSINVASQGEVKINAIGETQQEYPLLADGYEIVVRGLLEDDREEDDGDEEHPTTPSTADILNSLHAVTSASTTDGVQTWTTTPIQLFEDNVQVGTDDNKKASTLCIQSHAHSRITQLLRLRDAANFIGEENDYIIEDLVTLSKPCPFKTKKLATCIEEDALSLALEANIVVKGLTGMVTIDDNNCLDFVEGETDICLDASPGNDRTYSSYSIDEYSQDYLEDEEYSYNDEDGFDRDYSDNGGDGGGDQTSAPQEYSPPELYVPESYVPPDEYDHNRDGPTLSIQGVSLSGCQTTTFPYLVFTTNILFCTYFSLLYQII